MIDKYVDNVADSVLAFNNNKIRSAEQRADYVKNNKDNFTPLAVSDVINKCIEDPDYIYIIKGQNSKEYSDTLKTFAWSSLAWIDALGSSNPRIRVDRPVNIMRRTGLRFPDFDMVYRAFASFVKDNTDVKLSSSDILLSKEFGEYAKCLRKEFVNFINDHDIGIDLEFLADFFEHWHKYRNSNSYRLNY